MHAGLPLCRSDFRIKVYGPISCFPTGNDEKGKDMKENSVSICEVLNTLAIGARGFVKAH